MTLHVFNDVIQGTEEWFAQRRGLVTASVVGKLLTPTLKVADNDTARGITATLVAERITGVTEDSYTNNDMLRGVMCEPIARDIYSGLYHQAEETGFMRYDGDGWSLGFSPDGVVGTDGLLEVKSPRAQTHVQTTLADKVPHHYIAQCQAGLLVSGRKWIDWVSYCGGLPLYVKRVYPDPDWFEAITAACIAFETNATALVNDYLGRVEGQPATERIEFLGRVELKL
jgi:predicted phage-related endonuclease